MAMAETGGLKALAHITGGGFFDNIPRVLPAETCAVIDRSAIPERPIFNFLMDKGRIEEREMYRTFNMGIGMVAIAEAARVAELREAAEMNGEELIEIGRIEGTTLDPHVILE